MCETRPFRLSIAQGCPDAFDWDGRKTEADEALMHECDAIYEVGPHPLEDWECEKLGMPLGTTNEDAHRKLRER
jgi:hypothetical protein